MDLFGNFGKHHNSDVWFSFMTIIQFPPSCLFFLSMCRINKLFPQWKWWCGNCLNASRLQTPPSFPLILTAMNVLQALQSTPLFQREREREQSICTSFVAQFMNCVLLLQLSSTQFFLFKAQSGWEMGPILLSSLFLHSLLLR